MDWENITALVVPVVFILTTGGVILFRPLTRRLGDLIEVMKDRRESGETEGIEGLREMLEHQNSRLELLERRLDFTESLLGSRDPERISAVSSRKSSGEHARKSSGEHAR